MVRHRLWPASLLLLATACSPTSPARPAADGSMPIGQVQGRGERSPLEGQAVAVTGTVSGNFVRGLGGFFLQDDGDNDPATSDALFVLPPEDAPELRSGDRVRVRGTVFEQDDNDHPGVTAVRAERIEVLGQGATIEPVVLDEPPADWEPLEGMRVRIDAELSLNGSDERYAETVASFGGRLWTPSEQAVPGSDAYRQLDADNARRSLVLDDASNHRDPERIWYLGDALPRAGSHIEDAEGIVDQRHGSWRLQLQAPLQVRAAPRPSAPQVGGNLRLAVFNMENYFNGDGRGGGFPTPRGAKTPQQLQAQTAKLVATLQALGADIAALMELENDGYGADASLPRFVAALNAAGPARDWRFVDAGHGPGTDTIRVGLIYRASRVAPAGAPAVLEGGPFGERSRVPLAQAFRRGSGPALVVVANHFKSKGCSEAEGADADQDDGQGCWNALRTDSARRLDAWLKTDPTGQGGDLQLVVGDLNAYAMEDPPRWLREAGWRDAFAVAGVEAPYSYVYRGQAGRLDHALLSPALAQRLRGAAEWHVNADEPDREGYARDNLPGPWRSSDHDPMLLGFDL
ncbi:endonuclease [Pseudoxanthomonas kalamensis DSM 18571]|uniref:ExeM/NucH family extracellular endonuclease n=1 Tax=Pseudoxanthomonas kalamensis TaxID=289483 RepID=UPI001390F228|nr:ExeM/NucH family extracellular endonuclease [Pseudoxanthomonas kalamensis]KAF1712379.1 endonuclease [Pseudoxanthomonas kalamensis DSM 18571]